MKAFSVLASYVNGYAFKPGDLGTEGKPIVKIKELKAVFRQTQEPEPPGEGV